MSGPQPSFASMLVALDESPRARIVLATAVAMARRMNAQVSLIRVLTAPTDIPAAAHTNSDHLGADLDRIVAAELRLLMDTAADVDFKPPIIVDGDPWRRILEVARRLDVDLIVMGSHRYHGVERVLGTVASRVVNHADRNVLVVHERDFKGLPFSAPRTRLAVR
jgi:nucleotide-binding universal stress UspA family protein